MKNWTQKAAAVATAILADLSDILPPPVRGSGVETTHLHWMLLELQKAEMSPTKACRWLGYAQALLVTRELATLDEMKMFNQRAGDGTGPAGMLRSGVLLSDEMRTLREQLEDTHLRLRESDDSGALESMDEVMETLRKAMACLPARILVVLETPEGVTTHEALSVVELSGGEWRARLKPLNVVSPPPPLTAAQHEQVVTALADGGWVGNDSRVFMMIKEECFKRRISLSAKFFDQGEIHVRLLP